MNDFRQHARTGWIETICGPVSSGKSTELLRRVRRALIARRSVRIFKPGIDDRYGGIGRVSTHDGIQVEAEPVRDAQEILSRLNETPDVVAIDEVQFFSDTLLDVVDTLASRGVQVLCCGLDLDFRGLPFGPVPSLLARSERVDKLAAVCTRCGESATRTQRLVGGEPALQDGPLVLVGGLVPEGNDFSYEARCRACHVLPASDPRQLEL
jgi:thymidine kinase